MSQLKITFFGQSAVLIEGTKTIIIDPFFTGNPSAKMSLSALPHIDYVLVTHDHFDHFGDTVAVAKRDNATLIAIHEVTLKKEVADAEIKTVGMNIGGTYSENGINFSMTEAIHSANCGSPAGFVVKIDGHNLYHAGDTSFWSGIDLVTNLFGSIDLAFLPIGGHYTMDITQAVMAVRVLKPKLTIPIHFNTWPIISADPEVFVQLCGEYPVKNLEPGESIHVD